jgi:signal transduction histidine kinase
LVACYGPHGKLLGWSRYVQAISDTVYGNLIQFATNNSLASSALQQGQASDSEHIGGPGDYSAIQRYAVKVTGPKGRTLGVIQVGFPVGTRTAALDTLLHLLLIVGVFTLVFSGAAGLFLANRALQPAKIAYARQRDFIADASHELRTPLTMLRSTVEVILRGSKHLPPDDVALLEDAVLETGHLTNLANNMLSLARLESEQVHIEEDVVNLRELASEVVKWAAPLAAERDIDLTVEPGDEPLVIADHALIEQAALVLLDNAIKYNHPHGHVKVRVAREGSMAVLEVRDTGIGIASQHLDRLGERFYRVDKARSRASGGAGLGLSIVRSIASRHGGSFAIVSEEGKGTTARLTLPSVEQRTGETPLSAEEVVSS